LPIRGGAAAIALFAAGLAAPALAEGSIPLDWAFGNKEGCHFFLTGKADTRRMVVLTGDTFTAYTTGCDFGDLVSEIDGVFTIEAVCSSLGKPIPGDEIVIVAAENGSYDVTLKDFGQWGPLGRCPDKEEQVLAL
jgi:hypothetical protein